MILSELMQEKEKVKNELVITDENYSILFSTNVEICYKWIIDYFDPYYKVSSIIKKSDWTIEFIQDENYFNNLKNEIENSNDKYFNFQSDEILAIYQKKSKFLALQQYVDENIEQTKMYLQTTFLWV